MVKVILETYAAFKGSASRLRFRKTIQMPCAPTIGMHIELLPHERVFAPDHQIGHLMWDANEPDAIVAEVDSEPDLDYERVIAGQDTHGWMLQEKA